MVSISQTYLNTKKKDMILEKWRNPDNIFTTYKLDISIVPIQLWIIIGTWRNSHMSRVKSNSEYIDQNSKKPCFQVPFKFP